jgi:5-methylcytosine-specific restriction endonuclease McrA
MINPRKTTRDRDPDLNRRVRERDNHTCQLCKKKKRASGIEIHHIFRWADSPGLRFDENNLICLCKKCHKSIKNKESSYAYHFLEIIKNGRKKPDN